MKRNILPAVFIFLVHTLSFSQDPIEIKYDLDPLGSYIVYCNNSDFCTYTVTVNLAGVSNLKANVNLPYQTEVKPGNHKLFDLRPVTLNLVSTFKIHYSYSKGCINPDENTGRMMKQLTKSIDDAAIQVKEQQDWLKMYFKKGKLERKSMFYDRKRTL